jgi:hypothetical protein
MMYLMIKTYYLIRFADGSFAGSPLSERTSNPETAGCFRECEAFTAGRTAVALGGKAVPYTRNEAGRLVEVGK